MPRLWVWFPWQRSWFCRRCGLGAPKECYMQSRLFLKSYHDKHECDIMNEINDDKLL